MDEAWGEITVGIEGVTPLLMHSAAGMMAPTTGVAKMNHPTPAEDAEKSAYWSKTLATRQLIIPATNLKASMISAAKAIRTAKGRRSVAPFIAAQTRIQPYEISLNTDKYEVDVQGVVVQRNRIFRARPKIWPWTATFDLLYHRETFTNTDVLRQVLERAGCFVGLMDYRPEKYGEFGQFKVMQWAVQP